MDYGRDRGSSFTGRSQLGHFRGINFGVVSNSGGARVHQYRRLSNGARNRNGTNRIRTTYLRDNSGKRGSNRISLQRAYGRTSSRTSTNSSGERQRQETLRNYSSFLRRINSNRSLGRMRSTRRVRGRFSIRHASGGVLRTGLTLDGTRSRGRTNYSRTRTNKNVGTTRCCRGGNSGSEQGH